MKKTCNPLNQPVVKNTRKIHAQTRDFICEKLATSEKKLLTKNCVGHTKTSVTDCIDSKIKAKISHAALNTAYRKH